MRELIEKIIQSYDLLTRNCVNGTDEISNIFDTFMDFGKQVCELQKVKCADSAMVERYHNLTESTVEKDFWDGEWNYLIDKESILNTPNICNEEFVSILNKILGKSVFDINQDKYKLVQFPESQQYMEEAWFAEEASLAFECEKFGNASYFIPINRLIQK